LRLVAAVDAEARDVLRRQVLRGGVKAAGFRTPTVMMGFCAKPGPMGLYDPAMDKDACGVGFIADTTKQDTRKTVQDALGMLVRMTHRGACGCEKNTGDGAGARARWVTLRARWVTAG
jgi:hypothetical protein